MKCIITSILLLILILPCCGAKSKDASYALKSPLAILHFIYSSDNTQELMKLFKSNYTFAKNNEQLFLKVLKYMYSHNDNLDLYRLESKSNFTTEDKMGLSIRILARITLSMGEIDIKGDHLLMILNMLNDLPPHWRVEYYFKRTLYNAMAKNHPEKLFNAIENSAITSKGEAYLSLLRHKENAIQNKLKEVVIYTFPIIYYIEDPIFKADYLNKEFLKIKDNKYMQRCWQQREIINALASFTNGKEKLKEFRQSNLIDYINIEGVYFGTLYGSGVKISEITQNESTLQQATTYIKKVNEYFDGPERILYIDISPNEIENQKLNAAGWGTNHLFMTIGNLCDNSPRAVTFTLLHEACEQKFSKGYFSREMGRQYIEAFENSGYLLKIFKLGNRIGGKYTNTGLGHPWDSEREWLAEVGSAFVIGEKLPHEAKVPLISFEKLLRYPK